MTKNKVARQLYLTGLTIILFMGLTMAWFWKKLPPQLPWFYSLPVGEQQLVDKIVLAGILLGMVLFLGITRLLAKWASKGDIPVETTVMAGALMPVVLFAASFFRIIQIFAL